MASLARTMSWLQGGGRGGMTSKTSKITIFKALDLSRLLQNIKLFFSAPILSLGDACGPIFENLKKTIFFQNFDIDFWVFYLS